MSKANAVSKETVESEVVRALQNEEYTLNTVNKYGENLLHISAANGCLNITRQILERMDNRQNINRKNEFGWTPLMHAIRNRDIDMVKLLLENDSNVNESTYLGMSVLGLAAAISKEMFEVVYNACPSALSNTVNDDITPLCIAAMRNDKDLFFRLIDLGLDVSKANEFTHIVMSRSTVPEIAELANLCIDIENYWNDVSDNIDIEDDSEEERNQNEVEFLPKVTSQFTDPSNEEKNSHRITSSESSQYPVLIVHSNSEKDKETNQHKKYPGPRNLNLLSVDVSCDAQSVISPVLSYNHNNFPKSPNINFMRDIRNETSNTFFEMVTEENSDNSPSPILFTRLQTKRPLDIIINDAEDDPNVTLGFNPEFSPPRSPCVKSNVNEEVVFGENTPTPPRYKTPPKGMVLNSQDTKMAILLKQFGLGHHIPIFLEEEIDIDLFLTLTEQDLIEIGIQHKSERDALLAAINECRKAEE